PYLAADGVLDVADADEQRPRERLSMPDRYHGSRIQPELPQVAQQRRIVVLNARYDGGLVIREITETRAHDLGEDAFARRDRVAMRVQHRPSEKRVDPLFHLLGEHVLEPLRLAVDLVPGIAERFVQVQLEQAVVAQHLE